MSDSDGSSARTAASIAGDAVTRPAAAGAAREGRWGEIYERSLDCVHCGLCLPTCPTYRETGREISSPRGRIYLLRGIAEGRLDPGEVLADEAYLCLGCRHCETACPSGVQFGRLLELARAEVQDSGLRRGLTPGIERFALRQIVAKPERLRALFSALALAQRTRLVALAQRILPARVASMLALLPPVPAAEQRRPLPELVRALGPRRGRVGFLSGCVMSELFADVNAATVRVLARNGFDVVIPRGQGCCGALLAHSGDDEAAAALAEKNIAAFAAANVDAVISNSAGCGAALRETSHWVAGDAAEHFAGSARDVCEWLDAAGLRAPTGRIEGRVCYDDPCHLVHGQRVEAAPRKLLQQISGLTLVPHADAASCCGAAGTYNLTHPEMSQAVLARKLDSLAAASPDYIATGNPGCLMQLRAGVAMRGFVAEVVHPIVLLDRAYRGGEG
jgi:glycolate oxidase iron-sulfur subunit